jgi:hypothetical protein
VSGVGAALASSSGFSRVVVSTSAWARGFQEMQAAEICDPDAESEPEDVEMSAPQDDKGEEGPDADDDMGESVRAVFPCLER